MVVSLKDISPKADAELQALLQGAFQASAAKEKPADEPAEKVVARTRRPDQMPPPGDWFIWQVLAGRGMGKTFLASEWVKDRVNAGAKHIALIGATVADVRDTMVLGPAGILEAFPKHQKPRYTPSGRLLQFHTGAIAHTYSADAPRQLRGPEHDTVWADELAAWRGDMSAWDMALMGLRSTKFPPRALITTTPRPLPLIKALMKDPGCVTTRGRTMDNAANLDPKFLAYMLAKYQGTRLGRQELEAEILDDNPGALFKRAQIDDLRVSKFPPLARIVVAIDPAVTSNPDSDETGIMVLGLGKVDKHGYLLDDKSGVMTVSTWAHVAVTAYHQQRADRIVAEVNNGGDLVELNIRTVDPRVAYRAVHASRGKVTRAEPIGALVEQGKIHHVGSFPELEDQLCDWDPTAGKDSPDRYDAYVWGFTDLMLANTEPLKGPSYIPHQWGRRRSL